MPDLSNSNEASILDCGASDVSTLQDSGNQAVDRCFQLLDTHLAEAKWVLAEEADGMSISYFQSDESTTCWARLSVPTDQISYEDKVAASHPEALIGREHVHLMWHPIVLRLLAPGDSICRFDFNTPELTTCFGALAGSLFVYVRYSLRRDFPKPDTTTVVMLPAQSSGPSKWIAAIVKRPEDGGYNTEHYIELPWPTFPTFAAPSLLRASKVEIFKLGQHAEFFAAARSHYLILSLRSCSRGPPLLPSRKVAPIQAKSSSSSQGATTDEDEPLQAGGFVWAKQTKEGFNFAAYLLKFLEVIGFQVDIWDSLYGKFLVPYQAVIRASDWRTISAETLEVFQVQRTIYRRAYGGRTAPKVVEGKDPHFTEIWTTEFPNFQEDFVMERNTFFNLSKMRRERRAAEYP